mmetsp:Transcript_1254/g.5432  ORF Transcript_1254/g.5432 Transcript_1254/m.5432 type:complete len:236 (-) Transcript_1254:1099-1806(-)
MASARYAVITPKAPIAAARSPRTVEAPNVASASGSAPSSKYPSAPVSRSTMASGWSKLADAALNDRIEASGVASLSAGITRAPTPPGAHTISTGLSAASAPRRPPAKASSRHAPRRNLPVAQSAAHTPIQVPPVSSSGWSVPSGLGARFSAVLSRLVLSSTSRMATQYVASGDASVMPVSTSVPRVSTATFSRVTTLSLTDLSLALRSASCAGVSVCSTTTTLCPARARRSALAA